MEWEHIRTGGRYVILDFPQVLILDGWVEGVYYESLTDGATYVLTRDSFEKSFAKVSS